MIEELLIRDATEDDIPFFFNSTLHHYKHSSPHPKLIPDHLYYQNHQVLMARMLERKGHVLKFAALRDEPDVVFGFLWGNSFPQTIHYCYVKKAFRGLGIASQLFASAFERDTMVYYTHLTYDAGKITQTRSNFIFNPYLLHGDLWRLKQAQLEDEGDPERLETTL